MHSFKLIISCFYITVAIPTMPKRKENESEEIRNKRLEADRLRKALSRGNEIPDERNRRLEAERNRARSSRSIATPKQRKRERNTNESEEIRNKRLEADRLRKALRRANETPEERNGRLESERNRARARRSITTPEPRKRERNTNESEEIDWFTHGMFYISVSRTVNGNSMFIKASNKRTRNVDYQEAL